MDMGEPSHTISNCIGTYDDRTQACIPPRMMYHGAGHRGSGGAFSTAAKGGAFTVQRIVPEIAQWEKPDPKMTTFELAPHQQHSSASQKPAPAPATASPQEKGSMV